MAHVKNWAISVEAKADMKEIELRDFHHKSEHYKYYITKDGCVYRYSVRGNKYTEMYYHIAHGYRRVRIKDCTTNTRRYYRVGRLVAGAFVHNNNPDLYDIVNHIDGDKLNDDYSNLEWCNISINTQHAYDHNLVFDKGGWIGTPYHVRQANTEISKGVKKSLVS